MKYFAVANESHLGQFARDHHSFLVEGPRLSHTIYREFFENQSRFGAFLMLDTGVAGSTGEPGLETDYLDVGNQLAWGNRWCDEVIVPDVMMDKDGTIETSMKYYHLIDPCKRVVVPQGKTFQEWVACIQWFQGSFSFVTIGIPKVHDRHWGRMCTLQWIYDNFMGAYNVHLLGCSETSNPVREVMEIRKNFPWVRSLDTAFPFAMAQHDVGVMDFECHYSYRWDIEWQVSGRVNYYDATRLFQHNFRRYLMAFASV